jgi:hypothetical protein
MAILLDGSLGITTPGITNTGSTTLVNLTTTGNTILGDASTDTLNVGNGNLILDASGNAGLGVTPSAWSSSYKAVQVGRVGAIWSGTAGNDIYMSSNFYYDGTNNKYITTNYASFFSQTGGGAFTWNIAPSGTAGTNATFTQAMTLDASGNLGIGTTSPARRLHVFSSTAAEVCTLESTVLSSDNVQLRFKGFSGERWAIGNNIATGGTGVNFDFYDLVSSALRARIDSSCNLLVGTTSSPSSARFACYGSVADYFMRNVNTNASPAGMTIVYSNATPNNGGQNFLYMQDASVLRATFTSNGGLTNYQANNANLSDRREKTNFAPSKSYLDTICAIPVQTFNYIDQNLEEDDGLTLGVIAQDVQAVAPELVKETNWGTEEEPKMRLSIYQTDLQYALMKCIQEQQAIIESLKARLDAANL